MAHIVVLEFAWVTSYHLFLFLPLFALYIFFHNFCCFFTIVLFSFPVCPINYKARHHLVQQNQHTGTSSFYTDALTFFAAAHQYANMCDIPLLKSLSS